MPQDDNDNDDDDDDAVVSQSRSWGQLLRREKDASASFVQLFSVCFGIQFHSFMRLIEFGTTQRESWQRLRAKAKGCRCLPE